MNDLTKTILSVMVAVAMSTGATIINTNDRLARLETRLEHIDDKLAHGFLLSAEKRVSQLEWRVEQLQKIVTKWSGMDIP